jgi:hypothetical protein
LREEAGQTVNPGRFSGVLQRLQNLQLLGVRTKFVNMKGSPSVHKKMSLAFYLVPCVIFTAISFSSFISSSFGIYLKYQALVDSYYQSNLDAKYNSMLDNSKKENREATLASRSESILE